MALLEEMFDQKVPLRKGGHADVFFPAPAPNGQGGAFSFDIFNRVAQGILNSALDASKALSTQAKADLAALFTGTNVAAAGRAVVDFIARYKLRLADLLSATQLAALLSGAQEVAGKLPSIPPGDVPLPPPPDLPEAAGDGEQIQWPVIEESLRLLGEKQLVTREVYDRLGAAVRERAFTVAGVDAQETLGKIRDALAETLQEAPDLEVFKEKVLAVVDEGTFLSEAHLETVFRTNIQSAFSDGQLGILQHPLIRGGFPYASYEAIHDDRVRHDHLALEKHGIGGGNVYRINDPVFQTFRPPWDYNDRCSWIPMTVRMAAEKGVAEAQQWLAGGVEPSPPAFVAMPPFEPPPAFRRAVAAAPLSVRMSLEPLPGMLFAAEEWRPYQGARQGRGWQNARTGEVRYQQERPDGGGAAPVPQAVVQQPATQAAPPSTSSRILDSFHKRKAQFEFHQASQNYDPESIAKEIGSTPREVAAALLELENSGEGRAARQVSQAHAVARQAAKKQAEAETGQQRQAVEGGAYQQSALGGGAWTPVKSPEDFKAQLLGNQAIAGYVEDVEVAPGTTPEGMNTVGQALVNLAENQFRLPPKIVVGPPPSRHGGLESGADAYRASDAVAEAALVHTGRMTDAPETLYFPPGALDPTAAARGYASGRFSTPDPYHKLVHELGHFAQVYSGAQSVRKADSPESLAALQKSKDAIRQEVGEQATYNPMELVAEVFTGVKLGQKYSPAVLEAYTAAGGPRIAVPHNLRQAYGQVPAKDRAAYIARRGQGGAPMSADLPLRAPAGGALVDGVAYEGGQFLPTGEVCVRTHWGTEPPGEGWRHDGDMKWVKEETVYCDDEEDKDQAPTGLEDADEDHAPEPESRKPKLSPELLKLIAEPRAALKKMATLLHCTPEQVPEVVGRLLGIQLSTEDEWRPYEGAPQGRGWQNARTGEVLYQQEKPGREGAEQQPVDPKAAKKEAKKAAQSEFKDLLSRRTAPYREMTPEQLTKKRYEIHMDMEAERRASEGGGLRGEMAQSAMRTLFQEKTLIEWVLAEKWNRPNEAKFYLKTLANMFMPKV